MTEAMKNPTTTEPTKIVEEVIECSFYKKHRKTIARGAMVNFHSIYCPVCETRRAFTLVGGQNAL